MAGDTGKGKRGSAPPRVRGYFCKPQGRLRRISSSWGGGSSSGRCPRIYTHGVVTEIRLSNDPRSPGLRSARDNVISGCGEHGHQFLALTIRHVQFGQRALDVIYRDLPFSGGDLEAGNFCIIVRTP